ncbi:MAG TPA: hypothetical protein PKA00_08645 [Saprospiraceae bacterium]|nr:hypothetical protein [Saprospiraceae bacterium]HMQ82963.1 hypothetical protein [Saprospiraceae bacterium]
MIAELFVLCFYTYLGLGLLFGAWFVFRGVDRLDPNIHGASWRTRLLLLPAAAGLWIVLLTKLVKAKRHDS